MLLVKFVSNFLSLTVLKFDSIFCKQNCSAVLFLPVLKVTVDSNKLINKKSEKNVQNG